jgi:hypothetical protein
MVEVAIVGYTVLVGAFLYIQSRFNTINETPVDEPTVNGMIFIQR